VAPYLRGAGGGHSAGPIDLAPQRLRGTRGDREYIGEQTREEAEAAALEEVAVAAGITQEALQRLWAAILDAAWPRHDRPCH
jgi:hypothetical protein